MLILVASHFLIVIRVRRYIITGQSLLNHFNTDAKAKELAHHGEMASIDGNDGSISGYKDPDSQAATVPLNEFLSLDRIESLYLWRDDIWQVKSDYHLDNSRWHPLSSFIAKVGDKVNLNRDSYITSQPRPVWEVVRINSDGVYVLRYEVLPGTFQTEHMKYGQFTLCDSEQQTPPVLTDKQKDLQAQMSRLSELSAEIELHNQKLKDDDDELDPLEQEYQNLFASIVMEFGN